MIAHRAPVDKVLLRVFVGGALFPEQLERTDARMVDDVHACLTRLLRIAGTPRDAVVTRWPRSMPQYHVGHLERIERMVLPDVEFYSAITSHLPKWAYLYLTPADDRVSIPTEDGPRAFLRFPVMLHQGRAIFFIEPDPD